MVKVNEYIVDVLERNDIEVVFGVIGSANSFIFDALSKSKKIKVVATHHEQAAVMAMGAYYRTTGKLAVALVTAGGGTSNAYTGILSNWADSIPGIIIAGQEQSYYVDEYEKMRMFGVQGHDFVSSFKNCTKLSVRLCKKNIVQTFKNAFKITLEPRPGPVYLEIPFDFQGQSIIELENEHSVNTTKTLNKEKDFDVIIEMLNNSKKPVILGGHGVKLTNAQDLFKKFVNYFNIPTVLSWSGIDILPSNDICNFGCSGIQGHRSANFIIQNCDLLIVMGSRLSLLQTGYSRVDFAPHAEIIHIDIDPLETTKFKSKVFNTNVRDILTFLLEKSVNIKLDIKPWNDYCLKIKKDYPMLISEHLSDKKSSYTFIKKLSNLWPDNTTIVTDMGTALLCGFYAFEIKENQKMFTSLGLGEMGYGLAAAVGAGFGKNPVLCLNCDGGMMMNLQELQTIKNYNLPVKIIIFNNDGYLMIKHTQKMLFGGNKTCVDAASGLGLPNYKKLAYAFDYEYFTETEVEEFIKYKGQAIMEVFMDPEQEFIPKVKGLKQKDNTIVPGLLEEMSPILPFNKIEQAMISGINKKSEKMLRP